MFFAAIMLAMRHATYAATHYYVAHIFADARRHATRCHADFRHFLRLFAYVIDYATRYAAIMRTYAH